MESRYNHRKRYSGRIRRDDTGEKTGLVGADDTWLISLSDLLSLLVVFLVLLLVLPKSAKTPKTDSDELPRMPSGLVAEQAKEEVERAVMTLGLGDNVDIRKNGSEFIVTLREKISFPSGDAEILDTSKPVLDAISDALGKSPRFIVEIDGHTDNIPIRNGRYPSNWELSTARAANVLRYFVEERGIDAGRFYLKGNADTKPAFPNDDPVMRAKNRRVEIRLKEVMREQISGQ